MELNITYYRNYKCKECDSSTIKFRSFLLSQNKTFYPLAIFFLPLHNKSPCLHKFAYYANLFIHSVIFKINHAHSNNKSLNISKEMEIMQHELTHHFWVKLECDARNILRIQQSCFLSFFLISVFYFVLFILNFLCKGTVQFASLCV